MTSTPITARIGAILAAAAAASILTALPAVAATTSTTPPDCISLEKAEKALLAAQKTAAAAKRADEDAQSKLTTDQAHGASKTVIDADEAALGTAQSKMLLADNAVWTAQGTVESAKEAIQRDGVICPPPHGNGGGNGGSNGNNGNGGQGGNGDGTGSGAGTSSESSGSGSGTSPGSTVSATGGNASNSVQDTTAVNPTVVLDPTACDHGQATTSGDEVTDVPTGSASTGAARPAPPTAPCSSSCSAPSPCLRAGRPTAATQPAPAAAWPATRPRFAQNRAGHRRTTARVRRHRRPPWAPPAQYWCPSG